MKCFPSPKIISFVQRERLFPMSASSLQKCEISRSLAWPKSFPIKVHEPFPCGVFSHPLHTMVPDLKAQPLREGITEIIVGKDGPSLHRIYHKINVQSMAFNISNACQLQMTLSYFFHTFVAHMFTSVISFVLPQLLCTSATTNCHTDITGCTRIYLNDHGQVLGFVCKVIDQIRCKYTEITWQYLDTLGNCGCAVSSVLAFWNKNCLLPGRVTQPGISFLSTICLQSVIQ